MSSITAVSVSVTSVAKARPRSASGLFPVSMATDPHTVAVTALSPSTWQPAELVQPPQTETLMSSLSSMLSANTSPVLERPMPSQQARRKCRKKRRKKHGALDLLGGGGGGHGSAFRDNSQSDYSITSSTPASSDTEDRRSRPGTPTAMSTSSLMSPMLSPIMSPAMEPIRVDELEGMEALGLGHSSMNASSSSSAAATAGSTAMSAAHREAYKRRKDTAINYGRMSDASAGRPCSPLRLAHLLERVNSAEKAIERQPNEPSEHAASCETPSSERATSPTMSTTVDATSRDTMHLTKAMLTLSLTDAIGAPSPPLDSAISLCGAQANTNDTEEGGKKAGHMVDDASSCDGDDDDDGEEEHEHSPYAYGEDEEAEDPTEYDDNSIIEAELDDDVPELPSLMGAAHGGMHRTNPIGAILKSVKQHTYVHEWPMDDEERKRLEEEGLLDEVHGHCDNNNGDDNNEDGDDGGEDCRLVSKYDGAASIEDDPGEEGAKEEEEAGDVPPCVEEEDIEAEASASSPASHAVRQLDEGDVSTDDDDDDDGSDHAWAPSRGFAQVRAHYLARQNLMLERELGHARNTAHALREIIRSQEDRLRESDLLNRNLRERIRSLELSISRELADIQQKRHFGLSSYSRKRLMQSGGHARRSGTDATSTDSLLRRPREDSSSSSKPLTLSAFRLEDERDDNDDDDNGRAEKKPAPKLPRPSVSLWQVASPEPPATPDDTALDASPSIASPNLSLIEQDAQQIAAQGSQQPAVEPGTSTDEGMDHAPPDNASRRDLAAVWRDLRAEKSIIMPTEDEGYNSGHNKESCTTINSDPTTATTMTTTTTTIVEGDAGCTAALHALPE
ncbi:hypothetical protein SYNPS1DRAFT_29716 [Syncephalis pseudoplumigaleata]|uniref:Uncharacterized protein n=1 Tax=Syncephalis pseudoplumigaleata TaxID=1712513 RepID=A0A4P9YY90_9FUNG|nr:hypothetical protein SYNPS1DRAFT_29716 [Syncephalis pseudoplumigaleata]|eukprot:RKP24522.1 hypothetical protein SYNPS1DRAFT_29716 [Syncephalis pseudoplumigaleata]